MLRWQTDHGRRSSSALATRPHRGFENNAFVTVQRGETLYSIAFRNNLDFHKVAAWNSIGPSYKIYPGERIRLTPPPKYLSRRNGEHTRPLSKAAIARTRNAEQNGPIPLDSTPPNGFPKFDIHDWRWPIDGPIVQQFDPAQGYKGIDIAGHFGQPVVASAPGKVVYSGNALKGYGQLIIVKHNARYLSAYAYNSRMFVKQGQWVRAGQVIATVGEGPRHRAELHFEIRDRGKPVNPLWFLPKSCAPRCSVASGH